MKVGGLMSRETSVALRQTLLYQVYVRNHTREGSFKALIKDLDRIKALGTDVVYLLPIHPIGEEKRKGSLGSPYAIKDYYALNPELGTLDDFEHFIRETHARGMKVMMDIVFNHTSPDSILIKEHPEYFYRNNEGKFANRVGDWWDIVDLDYANNPGLQTYLIENLLYWQRLGVDGFRFDVASMLPLNFLEAMAKALKANDSNVLLLSESVHESFVRSIRNHGFACLSEGEIFQVFDMAYDYDTHVAFEAYLKGECSLKTYKDELLKQEAIYPANYVKLRQLENHDFGRIADKLNGNHRKLMHWHAFMFFNKGATMVFSGTEYSAMHHPSLFDKDTISREGKDLSLFISRLAQLVKDNRFSEGIFHLETEGDVMVGSYKLGNKEALGVFHFGEGKQTINVSFDDGEHVNHVTQETVVINDHRLTVSDEPIIIMKN